MDERTCDWSYSGLPVGLDVRFCKVMDVAPVMIWVSGQDCLCNWFNRPWLRFTGRSIEQELGSGWTEGVHPDDRVRCLNIYESHFDDQKEFRMEYRLLRYDGIYRWIDDAGIPRYDHDGKFLGYIGSCVDIQGQRQALDEMRRHLLEVAYLNRSADAAMLSAAISHELNQPLAAIMANTEAAEILLTAGQPDLDQVKEILADIRRDDQRAADVISHMRGFLRKSEVTFHEIDLNDTVRIVHEILGPYAAAKGVQLSIGRELGSLAVRADPIQLQQVVLNLGMNGVEAIDGSTYRAPTLLIQTARVDAYTAEISVADSGAGIPVDRLELIFEPFFTTKQKGTGLGLSIARAIVENHGGMIWAEHLPQGGTMFRLTLPLAIELPT
ncbi:PAS domain S-box protein [Mesorhizobium waimense]|uniref:histidine kinase n=1 Tax=Mesorhizobium waimense TaxID=1300307 RepID=A0A3A5JZY8_9HYPH|nr:PAS domain-containing sensor histidine kinase [Mesorhizobium waimense]RJT28605.1 PAS domain S-box protein [Mesorhizobium waimense]